MKTHLSFATSDLEKSVTFYSTLLNANPTKMLPDYALFITEEPGLELALGLRDEVRFESDAHYGVCVETALEVERAIERLKGRGLVSSVERGNTCCYANQTKVWTVDPEGRRWEVYTVHDETEDRDNEDATCCAPERDSRSRCVA